MLVVWTLCATVALWVFASFAHLRPLLTFRGLHDDGIGNLISGGLRLAHCGLLRKPYSELLPRIPPAPNTGNALSLTSLPCSLFL